MITFSIITPVFNSVGYIKACLENVIEQNVSSVEHLIMDGGSTDGTLEIIRDYAEKFPHIQWVSEKDKGQSDAMNKGIKLAKGEYLSFLNVDDSYECGTLEFVFSLLKIKKHNFIVGNCDVRDNNGVLIYTSKPKENTIFSCYFKQTYPINPVCYFYKKEIHDKIGYYNLENHFAMDLEFILTYMNTYKKYHYVSKLFGTFNLVEDSKTFNDKEKGLMMSRRNDLFSIYWKKNHWIFRFGLIILNKILRKY
jgi:glycosyltransferase involved in cell wall biosynthesis